MKCILLQLEHFSDTHLISMLPKRDLFSYGKQGWLSKMKAQRCTRRLSAYPNWLWIKLERLLISCNLRKLRAFPDISWLLLTLTNTPCRTIVSWKGIKHYLLVSSCQVDGLGIRFSTKQYFLIWKHSFEVRVTWQNLGHCGVLSSALWGLCMGATPL